MPKLGLRSTGLALALQVKGCSRSAVLSGNMERMLVNVGPVPESVDMVIRRVLLNTRLEFHDQMTKTVVGMSVASSMVTVQVRLIGAVLPANSGPVGAVTTTFGVETKEGCDY